MLRKHHMIVILLSVYPDIKITKNRKHWNQYKMMSGILS
jgi:hypothetical protein